MDEHKKPSENQPQQDYRGPIPLADRRRVVLPKEKPDTPVIRDWASI